MVQQGIHLFSLSKAMVLTAKDIPGAVFTNMDQDQIKFEKKISSEPRVQTAIHKARIT